jgi:protein-tyrosine-phosphatase
MKVGSSEKRSVTPKQAIAVLEKHGYQINEKEAEQVLNFLYFLGRLTVDQYIKDTINTNNTSNENSRSIRKGKH